MLSSYMQCHRSFNSNLRFPIPSAIKISTTSKCASKIQEVDLKTYKAHIVIWAYVQGKPRMKIIMVILLLFYSALPAHMAKPSNDSDQQSLMAFKTSLLVDPYKYSLLNWFPNHTYCNWTGVICSSRRQRVVSLNLTEYGIGGRLTTKGDVYSYGILVLELLTKKRPTDDMFSERLNLPKWAAMNFPDRISDLVDSSLLIDTHESERLMVMECLTQSVQIGLFYTRELPQERLNMIEIVERLNAITGTLLGTPENVQLPVDISPFLDNTKGINMDGWSTSTS